MQEAEEIKTDEKGSQERGKRRADGETDPESASKGAMIKLQGLQAEGDQLPRGNHLLTAVPSLQWCDLT